MNTVANNLVELFTELIEVLSASAVPDKPYNAPCPKCGARYARIRYYPAHGVVKLASGVAPEIEGYTVRRGSYSHAVKDCLIYDCDVCGHVWAADPLKAE